MGWLRQTLHSSVGGKFIVAVTGLVLVGFIVAHLSDNLLIFSGPDAVDGFAETIHSYTKLLWTMRIGLLIAAVLHIGFAVKLNLQSKAARPLAYQRKQYVEAPFTSRSMLLTGLLILFYILFHLAQFTFRVTSPELQSLGSYDVYRMLVYSFSNPAVALFYILAMIVLGMHLSHGISSLFQSLGWNHKKYNKVIRLLGPVLGTLLALGYISIPVAIQLGLLK